VDRCGRGAPGEALQLEVPARSKMWSASVAIPGPHLGDTGESGLNVNNGAIKRGFPTLWHMP